MDFLLQFQADQLGVPVTRPAVTQTTALGAAYLAGLAEGVWSTLDEIARCWRSETVFQPSPQRGNIEDDYAGWLRAVERSRG